MALCPRTGSPICRCREGEKLARTSKGAAMLLDLKCALRRVFTEHTVYTSSLIVASLPELNSRYAKAVTTRILMNPADIAALLRPIIEPALAGDIEAAFTEHLKLAAATFKPIREHDGEATEVAVDALVEQGNLVALYLSAINPHVIPIEEAEEEFRQHNLYVAELATLREQEKYEQYVEVYDTYRAHMDGLSDLIYAALITRTG